MLLYVPALSSSFKPSRLTGRPHPLSKLDTPAFLLFAAVFCVMRIVVYPLVVLRA